MKNLSKTAMLITIVLLIVTPLLAITFGWLDGNRHPNVGAWGFTSNGELVKLCSGTLISPTVFLTAAHCTSYVESLGITQAEVTFDSTFSATSKFYTGTIHTNPGFKNVLGPDPGDVGVIVFEEPIVGITSAAIAPVGTLDKIFQDHELKNQRFTTVGYGVTAEFRKGPPVFTPNFDRRYAISEFIALTEGFLHVSENPAQGNGGTCFGDSGGPTFLGAEGNETAFIVAITDKGDHICRASDVRYRVDTPTAQQFIGQYVTLP